MKDELFQQLIVSLLVAVAVLFIERHLRSHEGGGCKCSGGGGAKASPSRGFCGVR